MVAGRLFIILSGILIPVSVWCADLSVGPEDLRIEQGADGGYHLYIRETGDIESVLLTESTADPQRELAVYALRNPEYHPENGDEKRMLNGEFLDPSDGLYSIIDSTPEAHDEFGTAFHVFIPYVVTFGYPWSRSGEIQVLDGTYLNVRAFAKPFGDYGGGFEDNPFVLRVTQRPLPGPPEGNYMAETVETYTSIAGESGGDVVFSQGQDDLVEKIIAQVDRAEGETLDMVVALDTTQSMTDDIPHVRAMLVPLLEEHTTRFRRFRIGLVYYRDYHELYLTYPTPFVTALSDVQKAVDGIRVHGGRDIPEAVHEALYVAVTSYEWQADVRMVLLIGDAPPHRRPRGKITREMVQEAARERGVAIHSIILPQ
jgi:hypothetical protein